MLIVEFLNDFGCQQSRFGESTLVATLHLGQLRATRLYVSLQLYRIKSLKSIHKQIKRKEYGCLIFFHFTDA